METEQERNHRKVVETYAFELTKKDLEIEALKLVAKDRTLWTDIAGLVLVVLGLTILLKH